MEPTACAADIKPFDYDGTVAVIEQEYYDVWALGYDSEAPCDECDTEARYLAVSVAGHRTQLCQDCTAHYAL